MSKNCKDFKVVELRKMASKKGIKGYSKNEVFLLNIKFKKPIFDR